MGVSESALRVATTILTSTADGIYIIYEYAS